MANMKKRLAAAAIAVVTLAQIPLVGSASEAYSRGDVNGDTHISAMDALCILRHATGLIELDDKQMSAADVNLDGYVSLVDALKIQRYSSGIIDDFDNDVYVLPGPAIKPPVTQIDSDTESDTETDTTINSDNGFGSSASEDSSIVVSGTSYTVPTGMTLYVTCESDVEWGSTNTNVATVDENGLILGVHSGSCKIVALKGNKKRTINLTVTESEPIRTVYSSPNSAAVGSQVKLIATTDQTKTNVRFFVNNQTVYATNKTADNDHGIYTWTATVPASTSGKFDVCAYAESNGSWKTCDNGKTTMFVSASSSPTQTSLNTLRASDNVIKLISQYEGGLAEAEYDPLAYGNVMNYGYGVVIGAGEKFYNRASMSEYFADLVNQVNEKNYSSYVNKFLQDNGIKYNQYQFDALVCFCYNLGVYSLQNDGLKSILLDCYESSGTNTSSNIATVNVSGSLNVRSGPGTEYSIIGSLYNGDKVTILNSNKENGVWLKIRTASGLEGYCSSTYLIVGGSSGSGSRNFNYINRNNLVNEVLAWHHAGGNCYWGLLYRRIDEMELFFFGDYTQDGYLNTNGWKIPSCIAG